MSPLSLTVTFWTPSVFSRCESKAGTLVQGLAEQGAVPTSTWYPVSPPLGSTSKLNSTLSVLTSEIRSSRMLAGPWGWKAMSLLFATMPFAFLEISR